MNGFKPAAIIWDDMVLIDTLQSGSGPRMFERMGEVFQAFRGTPMAIVTRDASRKTVGQLNKLGLLPYFQSKASQAIFSAADYEDTRIDPALTHAFLAARKSLGTMPQQTIAIVGATRDIRLARNAGLSVLGFAGLSGASIEDAHYTGDLMTSRGAFYAASTVLEMREAIQEYRPFGSPAWHRLAAPTARR